MEQIKFPAWSFANTTTERYLRSEQEIAVAVNDTPYEAQEAGAIWNFNRRENYDEGSELNSLFRPIEVGDIFARGSKSYVLIGPPCDLMVRSSGYRGTTSDLVREIVLAEVTDRQSAGGVSWKMDFFDKSGPRFVDFKKAFAVKLDCLDLCVFDPEGKAIFSAKSKPAELLIPAWEKRHGILARKVSEIITHFQRIDPTPKQKQEVERLLTRADSVGVVWGKLHPETTTIEMNVKRVARLLAPRSTALLKAYGAFLNRDAFNHPYGAADLQVSVSIQ